MNSLLLRLEEDADGNAELFVELQAGRFGGEGSAWFNLEGLGDALKAFEQFPLSATQPPEISGGIWNADATAVAQERVHISLNPLGSTGALRMTVKVAVSNESMFGVSLERCTVCDLETDYESVRGFVTGIRQLIAGQRSEFFFDAFRQDAAI